MKSAYVNTNGTFLALGFVAALGVASEVTRGSRSKGIQPDVEGLVATNGGHCPFCGATEQSGNVWTTDNYSGNQGNDASRECENCKARWTETRRIATVAVDRGPNLEGFTEPPKPGSPLAIFLAKRTGGSANWNRENVRLWLDRDWKVLFDNALEHSRTRDIAAREILARLPARTPDGAPYTFSSVRAALRRG